MTTALLYKDENFFVIYVSLTSELPWQRNDAITLFTCLCISRYQDFFFGNGLREFVPPSSVASIMAKFEQILRDRFGNILKKSFKGHKRSE